DHVNANAVEISPENGIVVTQSGLKTKFQADASKFGVYDDGGNMLAGAGYDANTGKGYFATRQIRNTSKNSEFRIEMTDDDLSGPDTGGEGLSCYKGTVLLGGVYAGQAIYSSGSGGGTVNYLRIWGSQNVEVTSEGALDFNASGAANYYSPENHYFTGGSILTERNIRPITNGAANCGLPDYRWRYIYTQNQVVVSSDAREKRDIAPIEDARALVMGLRPRQYRLRSEGKDGKRHTGFIAQHVLKLAPDWAAADGEDKDNLGLMYGEILAPLVQVVQDQQREIEELKARLSEMEASACGKSE
ncbi:MAG TPA: tail fiber domain-containing protein, partial [Candidatus Faecaligallichristensenella faecipullorum]|nr:tail fiber domain-containing protein [Candidatus Faecaligallichristensenella faecipullorum]